MSKRTLSVSLLTAGLTAGVLATAVGPAAAQGNPLAGEGNAFFLSGALNTTGVAQSVYAYGYVGDEVYYGDWNGNGTDEPMVRRGNVYFPWNETTQKTDVFVYGNPDDEVLVGNWDGLTNGVATDSLAVRRGNHFFVKNDNKTSGVADSEFYYGDAGDTVLVGNWDAQVTAATAGVDKSVPPDGDFTDLGSPAVAADISPANDPGFNAVAADGSYLEPGDRKPGTGVDNNGDGDYDDAAKAAVPADVAPKPGKADTIMIQRGGEFFVKNSISSGIADYTFLFGNPGDEVLVGDWATPATAKTAKEAAKPAVSGNHADQLAVRRGYTYYLSSELEAAHAKKTNPSTTRVFGFGNEDDAVFVASLSSPAVDEYNAQVWTTAPVYYSVNDPMFQPSADGKSGTAIMVDKIATSTDTSTQKVNKDGTLAFQADGTTKINYSVGDTMYTSGTANTPQQVAKLATSADTSTLKVTGERDRPGRRAGPGHHR